MNNNNYSYFKMNWSVLTPMENTKELTESLKAGFIDKDYTSEYNNRFKPELISNNPSENRTVLTSINDGLEICDEFFMSVAFATTSGVLLIREKLKKMEGKNVKGRIIISAYQTFTQPSAIKMLLEYKNIHLKLATNNLHTKCYFFKMGDICDIIIGSSNLTDSALTSNREWNLKVSSSLNGEIAHKTRKEFDYEFGCAEEITDSLLAQYEEDYNKKMTFTKEIDKIIKTQSVDKITINPMQKEALESLMKLRKEGKNKALLIAATGTGKTFLSAFDVKQYKPKRLLFVVHRKTIVRQAMETFKRLIGDKKTYGIYSGADKDYNSDYIFATHQSIDKDKFQKDEFDYIVIDEAHKIGGNKYQEFLNYFQPKFLLGMTATPERTDGFDIFKSFDYNIAYEIRLHRALEENMLCPFHYFGVSDLKVNGNYIDDKTAFNLLVSKERVNAIRDKSLEYGCDGDIIRGLIFCSSVEESKRLSEEFNKMKYKTISLSGSNGDNERDSAIKRIQSDDENERIDYIFTVDIFNEGVDIPKINQIIMLRPTQSSIIFIQQLGRGLRKSDSKRYVNVIDFIGNYTNNYLILMALTGDKSYNKDTLRKIMNNPNMYLPGGSTVEFDEISKKQIYKSIDSSKMQKKRDLIIDYKNLYSRLGRHPMMIDFLNNNSRDLNSYIKNLTLADRSYYKFSSSINSEIERLDKEKLNILNRLSSEINNSKRVEESIILKELLVKNKTNRKNIKEIIKNKFGYDVSDETISSAVSNINLYFTKSNDKIGFDIVTETNDIIKFSPIFESHLLNITFKEYLLDSIDYSISMWSKKFSINKYKDGFILYEKYSRKDVFRILNFEKNPIELNVSGYLVDNYRKLCPIFIKYDKDIGISETIKYDNVFINNSIISLMLKSGRTLGSPDVKSIRSGSLRLPLFIKKYNGENDDHYYMGDINPVDNSFTESFLTDGKGKKKTVVKANFKLETPVEHNMYKYITKDQDIQ